MSSREVRDAVHGLIDFSPQEWRLIDSSAFQRLRRIKQLAMTDLVYPGARHSRFEHCMGAAHVAGRTARAVNRQAADEVVNEGRVRAAALLHDVGHGPFSHVSEMVFEKRTQREHIHESISAAIIRHDPQVYGVLGDDDAQWIADLLAKTGHGKTRSVERDIIAGPADIDKLDYLLRDSHYCGVNYGRYDLDKVVEAARRKQDVGGTKLAYHTDGVFSLEEMLLARYHMHRQVYGHKTRVATDLMLVRAMDLGVDAGHLPKELFEPPEDPGGDFVSEYLKYDDEAVIRTLAERPGPSGELMRALLDRKLLKRIVQLDLAELVRHFDREMAGYIIDPDEATAREMIPVVERVVAERVGIEDHWVAVFHGRQKNPVLRPYSARVEGEDILLVDDADNVQMFHDISQVFSRGEAEPQRVVALYIRPPNDNREDLDMNVVTEAFLTGLSQLGDVARRV